VKPRSPASTLRCSFCHKSQDAVAKLISSPDHCPQAYICNACVAVCNSILRRDSDATTPSDSSGKTRGWFYRAKPGAAKETLVCSFCHRSQDAVAKLIGTPEHYPPAYICDTCVAVCNSMLPQEPGATTGADLSGKKRSWFHRVKSWWRYGMIEQFIFNH